MTDYYQKYLKYKTKYLNEKSKILDLNNNIVTQPQSFLIKSGIYAQKTFLGKKIASTATAYCENYNKEKGALTEIKHFVDNYKIDYKSILECQNIKNPEECWKRFRTPNDFFIRKRIGLPIQSSHRSLVSPADSYTILINNLQNSNFWIKGKNFTPQKLIFGENNNFDFSKYCLIIFRLAPHHYHRFHSPVNGKVLTIRKLGTEDYSVDPILVNSSVDVYTENQRLIIEIELQNNQKAYLAVIGATCVSSIVISHKNIDKHFHEKYNTDVSLNDFEVGVRNNVIDFSNSNIYINNNDELGKFQYGGSTIVLLYPDNDVNKLTEIGTKILKNSNDTPPNETEIRVGDELLN